MADVIKNIITRIDSSSNWRTLNPVPVNGEQCIEVLDGGLFRLKVGDGVTPWIALKYWPIDKNPSIDQTILNVSMKYPLEDNKYYNLDTALQALKLEDITLGMLITFESDKNVWETWQLNSDTTTLYQSSTLWEKLSQSINYTIFNNNNEGDIKNGSFLTDLFAKKIDTEDTKELLSIFDTVKDVITGNNKTSNIVSIKSENETITAVWNNDTKILDIAVSANLIQRIEEEIQNLDTKLDNEISRAIKAEDDLNIKIEEETSRATSEEQRIENSLNDEINRAKEAESALNTKIEAETTRATEAESALDTKIEVEINRATQAEENLDNKIEEEINRATQAEENLDNKIEEETSRATQAEEDLNTKIETETNRATSKENELASNLQAEITRATQAEENLDNKIEEETSRATSEEQRIENSLQSEISRATQAEENLNTKIENETARAIKAEENLDTKIEAETQTLTSSLQAEISRATEAEKNLNTKIETEINRATQSEEDLNTKLDNEISRATQTEEDLDNKIESEVTRATEAEQTLSTSLQSEINRATSKENELASNLQSEVTRATEAESALNTKIEAETTRATEVESTLDTKIETEISRAKEAEENLDTKLDNEISRATQAEQTLDNTTIKKSVVSSVQINSDIIQDNNNIKFSKTTQDTNTGETNEIVETIQVANSTRAGIMSKEAYQQIIQNSTDIAEIKGASKRYPVRLGTEPLTQEQYQTAWEQASDNPTGTTPPDGATLVNLDNNHAITYFENVEGDKWIDRGVDTVTLATNNAPGIVKGTNNISGDISVRSDGTMFVNSWDTLNDTINNHISDNTRHITSNERNTWNAKQNALTTNQLAAVNSGITSAKVEQYDNYATSKQNALTTNQLAAVNSGITSEKVEQYDNYATSKQNALTTEQLEAVNSGITAAKVSTYDNYATSKQDKLTAEQLAAVNSGITATKVSTYDEYSTSKQDTLTTEQLNAVNSGITSAKVEQYDNYASSKQDKLNTNQLAAVNSGITSEKVSTYDNYATSKQDKLLAGNNISIDNNKISAIDVVNYNNITNCILSIPQDINITTNGNTLTIKAGTNYYVPNGSGIFTKKTVNTDISKELNSNGSRLVILSYTEESFDVPGISNCFSQDTQPSNTSIYWWDTINNVINGITSEGLTPGWSLPIALINVDNGNITVNKLFNGIGFFGTTIFSTPGLLVSVPNGRNIDNTLKNINNIQTKVNKYTIKSFTRTEIYAASTQLIAVGKNACTYNFEDNKIYLSSSKDQRNYINIGTVDNNGTYITNIDINKPFMAIDYNKYIKDLNNINYNINEINTNISEINTNITNLETNKQDNLTAAQLNAVNSGITSEKVSTYDNYATSKQNTLNDSQLNAVNSGITSEKVEQYDNYATSKQDKLNTNQLNAVNSGITATKVSQIVDTNTNGQNIKSNKIFTDTKGLTFRGTDWNDYEGTMYATPTGLGIAVRPLGGGAWVNSINLNESSVYLTKDPSTSSNDGSIVTSKWVNTKIKKVTDNNKVLYLTGVESNSTGLEQTYVNTTVRIGNNYIQATNLKGTATQALWADLAERYESDNNYSIGTLIKFGGEKDITIATDKCNGVISEKPGFILDSGLENSLPVALAGKVSVRVIGKINKFDNITLSEIPGVGRVAKDEETIIAKALESSNIEDEKLILCVTKFNLN